MSQMLDLVRRWFYPFVKDYAEVHARLLRVEADNDMQWQTIKGLTAEIEALKK